MRSVLPTLVTMVSALLVSGCSPSSLTGPEPPIPENLPSVTSYAKLDLPLAPYMMTGTDLQVIWNAQATRVAVCAKKYGVTYIPEISPGPLPADELLTDRTYGVINPEAAAKHGYALSADEGSVIVDESYLDESPRPARDEEVLRGRDLAGNPTTITASDGTSVPEGGCYDAAWRELVGNPAVEDSFRALVYDGLQEAEKRMSQDSRARAVEEEFAACMRDRGYSRVKKLADAANIYGEKGDKQVAIDEAECSQQVNLPGIWHAVNVAYQERWVTGHEAELRQGLQNRQQVLARAKKVLAG